MIAAGCAALAVLLLFGSHDASAPEGAPERVLADGEDAVPAQVTGAGSLRVGDVLDLAATSDTGSAHVVAHGARVLELPADSGWSGGTGSLVLVAVADADALDVITASAQGHLVPLIHSG